MKLNLLRQFKSNKGGFVLVFAILMIMLLMVFLTAMVGAVGYANRVTEVKTENHQLQLTAQSALVTLKDMFGETANKKKLLDLVGKTQQYDLSASGIDDMVTASITRPEGLPDGYVLLTVTADDGKGGKYTTTTMLETSIYSPTKNALIQNMIVSYWPDKGWGFTNEQNYSQNIMDGSIIVDNEYYPGSSYYDTHKDQADVYYKEGKYATGTYGDINKYDEVDNDPYAVVVKGGSFKELITTGNLRLNAGYGDSSLAIKGWGPDSTIASVVGQLSLKGDMGSGDPNNKIARIGAGGYFEKKINPSASKVTSKKGSLFINNARFFDGTTNLYTRDSVDVSVNNAEGVFGSLFVGGKLNYNSNKEFAVGGDVQVYKDANYTISNQGKLEVAGDLLSGGKNVINLASNSSRLEVDGAIANARSARNAGGTGLAIRGSGLAEADSVLSGGDLEISAKTNTEKVFSGGNYGVGTEYLTADTSSSRGKTVIKAGKVDNDATVVLNNANGGIDGSLEVLNKESKRGYTAFKELNSLWLSKAQKVYKGGLWGGSETTAPTNVNFAVALVLNNSLFDTFINDESYKRGSITENPYNPWKAKESDRKALYQWYEKNEKVYDPSKNKATAGLKVSHEFGYTTDDRAFLLRSSLQEMLGGPTNSRNLQENKLAQGLFLDRARSAIPYDSAVESITVNLSAKLREKVNNNEYASVEIVGSRVYIGRNSNNFGIIKLTNDRKIWDDSLGQYVDINGKTLVFDVTSGRSNDYYGGDFYLTGENGSEIQLYNSIEIITDVKDTTEDELKNMGYVRIFVDPSKNLTVMENVKTTLVNHGIDVENHGIEDYQGFNYEGMSLMPELYIYGMRSDSTKTFKFHQAPDFRCYVVAPWTNVDHSTIQRDKSYEVFKGIILCKNLHKAQGGTYKHYRPITFNNAMNNEVFTVPDKYGDPVTDGEA